MTPGEFENELILKRAELTDAFKKGNVQDLDVYIKMVMDYQESIARSLFRELNLTQTYIANHRSAITKSINDNILEKHTAIMTRLENISQR